MDCFPFAFGDSQGDQELGGCWGGGAGRGGGGGGGGGVGVGRGGGGRGGVGWMRGRGGGLRGGWVRRSTWPNMRRMAQEKVRRMVWMTPSMPTICMAAAFWEIFV